MSKKKSTSDVYLRVLEFGISNPGFALEQLKQEFPTDYDWIYREITFDRLFTTNKEGTDGEYFLTFEDRFRLMEHEELAAANRSSRNAMIVATVSVGLTLAGLVYQIFFSAGT